MVFIIWKMMFAWYRRRWMIEFYFSQILERSMFFDLNKGQDFKWWKHMILNQPSVPFSPNYFLHLIHVCRTPLWTLVNHNKFGFCVIWFHIFVVELSHQRNFINGRGIKHSVANVVATIVFEGLCFLVLIFDSFQKSLAIILIFFLSPRNIA